MLLTEAEAQAFQVQCNQDDCSGLCYTFTSPFPAGTPITWDFGDGTVLSTTTVKASHCYTNVNTYAHINDVHSVSLASGGQPTLYQTLIHGNCKNGVFIGAVDGVTHTNLTSYTALPGSSFNGQNNSLDVFVYAIVIIDKDFTFTGTNVNMRKSAGFNLTAVFNVPKTLTLENNTVIGVPNGCNCLWRGIQMGGGSLVTNSNVTLKEALYAIAVRDHTLLDIRQTNFINNYIGLFAYGLNYNLNFFLSGSTFTSNSTLLDWCGGETIVNEANPFFLSSGNYNNGSGWAGICLYGFNAPTIGGGALATNRFERMANGIVLFNSNAGQMAVPGTVTGGIEQCTFDNIKRGAYSPDDGGNGIFFRDGEGIHFMGQTGLGMGNIGNPTFNDCEVGIHASYPTGGGFTVVSSTGNRMENMELGYRMMNGTGNSRAVITSNFIEADQDFGNGDVRGGVWVELLAQTANTMVHVDNNEIEVSQILDPGEAINGILIRNAFLDPNIQSGDITTNNNVVDILADGVGIAPVHLAGPVVRENIITISDNDNADGILTDSRFISILCNEITGPLPNAGNPSQRGINGILTQNATIRDNQITHFDRGIGFRFDCTGLDLSCNSMEGNNFNGLYYHPSAFTGPQTDNGNIWDCTSLDFEARNDNSSVAPTEPYHAQMGTNAFPDTWTPFDWFLGSSNPTPDCPLDPNCPIMFIEGGINSLDSTVAEGQLMGVPDGLVNSLEKSLYRKLMDNPFLLSGNTVMQSFVNTNANLPTGLFYDLSKDIRGLFDMPSAVQSQLESDMVDLQDIFAQLLAVDILLEANPSEPQLSNYLQQHAQLEQAINLLYNGIMETLNGLVNDRDAQADVIIADNSSIIVTSDADQNQKEVNDIFLNTLAKGLEASPAQLTTLNDIAGQCPEEGGIPVLGSIHMHDYFTGSNLSIQECGTGSRSSIFSEKEGVFELDIYPNPVNDKCLIEYKATDTSLEYEIYLIDGTGRLLENIPSKGGRHELDMGGYPTGIYFVQLYSGKTLLESRKLIKQ